MDYCKEVELIFQKVKKYLTTKDIDFADELITHDEWGVAFELICGALTEDKIVIPLTVFEKIQEVGMAMGLNSEGWKHIQTDFPKN